jgi:ubiquinone/menaquinone biosynthesis C-methylase UbiE
MPRVFLGNKMASTDMKVNLTLWSQEIVMGKTGKATYDAFAVGYSLWAQTRGQHFYEDALNFLPQFANRALDAGCGSGILSFQLADHVNYVVGLDISRSMIALAKAHQAKLKKDNVDFVVADLSNLPFKEGIFDFIASYNAIRLRSIELKVPSLCCLLKPGGRMVIHESITITSRLVGAFPMWQVLDTLRSAPKYAISYGLRTMLRILSFQLSPGWIRYLWKSKKLTPELFQNIYSRFLPGCSFKEKAWRMIAFWEAPETGKRESVSESRSC